MNNHEMQQELINMKMHETKELNEFIGVMRVCNGWIYTLFKLTNGVSTAVSSVFVPESINVNVKEDF